MKPKINNKSMTTFMCIVVYIILLMLSFHASKAMDENITLGPMQSLGEGVKSMREDPLGFTPISSNSFLFIGISTFIVVFVWLLIHIENEKNKQSAPGVESGSAEWNTDIKGYNKIYSDPPDSTSNKGPNNMILTKDISLNMDTRKTLRNNNILVVGGAGSGKSRFFVKPNLLQANCSYVITDPSGELLESTGSFLEKQGYEIKVFNLVEMQHSNCYNPFNYIRDELGVLMMINCLIKNTTPPGASKGDPFWEKSETALLQALVFYLIMYRPKEEQNFTSIMKLLRAAEVNENDPSAKSPLDRIFDDVAKRDPTSIALKQYQIFKMGAGKTLKSILISTSVRLTVFNMQAVENLTRVDTLDLGTVGDKKTALFVVIPAADDTYNFLVSMMYSQMFETLYFHAETECPGKRLPIHVRFMLDEFANIGTIPEFDNKLATMRKYEISCSVILQNLGQLKTMYKDEWGSITGNCDTSLFLGGKEFDTLESISKELGDATIVVRNNSRSRGRSGSSSLSYNKSARKLMNPDELARMSNSDCVLTIRGLRPFYGKKYDYTKHPNYKHTGDKNKELLYICSDHFDNSSERTKRVEINAERERAERVAKALTDKREKDELISEPKVLNDQELLKATGSKSVKEASEKLTSCEIKEEDDIETWNFTVN